MFIRSGLLSFKLLGFRARILAQLLYRTQARLVVYIEMRPHVAPRDIYMLIEYVQPTLAVQFFMHTICVLERKIELPQDYTIKLF